MQYITLDDLKADTYEQFLQESSGENHDALTQNEGRAIDIVRTYLSGRYDADKIFDPKSPIRNGLLVDIICKITLHRFLSRNAVRKLGDSPKEGFSWAIRQLEKLNAGRFKLTGLPLSKQVNSPLYGNNRNANFFI